MKAKDIETLKKYGFLELPELEYAPDDFEYYDNFLFLFINFSRRGQSYWLMAGKDTLNILIVATKPDGDGSFVELPNVLLEMIKNGDVT